MGQTIYISYGSLEDIYINSSQNSEYSAFERIISGYSDVVLNISDEEYENLQLTNPIIKSLWKRPDKKSIYPLKEEFENLFESEIYNNSRDIYIIDRDEEECQLLSAKSGVIVTNLDLIKKKKLTIFKRTNQFLEKNTTYSEKTENIERKDWELIFYKAGIEPINAIIINDTHLFNDWKKYIQNIIDIINYAIPKSLDCLFQVLILIENSEGKYKKDLLVKILNRIQDGLKKEVQISILTHPKEDIFHKRLIISNYQRLSSHYGFNVFKKGEVVKQIEAISIGNYYSLYMDEGDPEILHIESLLNVIKDKVSETLGLKNEIPHQVLVSSKELTSETRAFDINRLL